MRITRLTELAFTCILLAVSTLCAQPTSPSVTTSAFKHIEVSIDPNCSLDPTVLNHALVSEVFRETVNHFYGRAINQDMICHLASDLYDAFEHEGIEVSRFRFPDFQKGELLKDASPEVLRVIIIGEADAPVSTPPVSSAGANETQSKCTLKGVIFLADKREIMKTAPHHQGVHVWRLPLLTDDDFTRSIQELFGDSMGEDVYKKIQTLVDFQYQNAGRPIPVVKVGAEDMENGIVQIIITDDQ